MENKCPKSGNFIFIVLKVEERIDSSEDIKTSALNGLYNFFCKRCIGMACARKLLVRVLMHNSPAVSRCIAMSATRRAEEAVEKLKEGNPYYSKYADKISKLQQTSAEEFLDRVERVVNPIKDGKSQARYEYATKI